MHGILYNVEKNNFSIVVQKKEYLFNICSYRPKMVLKNYGQKNAFFVQKIGPKMLDHEGKEVPGNRGYK